MQKVEEYPVTIDGTETILFGFSIDPGDGYAIMVYVDATPVDDERRSALVDRIIAAFDTPV